MLGLYSGDRWAREATERLLPYASSMPNHTDFGGYIDIMWKGLEACWTGQKSPGDAVSEVKTELKNSLGDSIIIK